MAMNNTQLQALSHYINKQASSKEQQIICFKTLLQHAEQKNSAFTFNDIADFFIYLSEKNHPLQSVAATAFMESWPLSKSNSDNLDLASKYYALMLTLVNERIKNDSSNYEMIFRDSLLAMKIVRQFLHHHADDWVKFLVKESYGEVEEGAARQACRSKSMETSDLPGLLSRLSRSDRRTRPEPHAPKSSDVVTAQSILLQLFANREGISYPIKQLFSDVKFLLQTSATIVVDRSSEKKNQPLNQYSINKCLQSLWFLRFFSTHYSEYAVANAPERAIEIMSQAQALGGMSPECDPLLKSFIEHLSSQTNQVIHYLTEDNARLKVSTLNMLDNPRIPVVSLGMRAFCDFVISQDRLDERTIIECSEAPNFKIDIDEQARNRTNFKPAKQKLLDNLLQQSLEKPMTARVRHEFSLLEGAPDYDDASSERGHHTHY